MNRGHAQYSYYRTGRRRWLGCLGGGLLVAVLIGAGLWLGPASGIRPVLPALPALPWMVSGGYTPPTWTTAAPPPAIGDVCPSGCADLRSQLLALVNQDRAANGQAVLTLYEPASVAAQEHAEDMLRRGYFDHINPEGDGPGERLARAHAGPARFWAENIWSYRASSINGTPVPVNDWPGMLAHAEDDWMHSLGHRANLLNSTATSLGVGISYDATMGKARMVQVFFTPQ